MYRRKFIQKSLLTAGSFVAARRILSASSGGAGESQPTAGKIEKPGEGLKPLHDVMFAATKEHPRFSEASIIELKDGQLLLVYSDFYAGGSNDTDPSRLSGRLSSDRGLHWGEPFVIVENAAVNTMAASLIRLKSGAIGLFFNRHHDRASQSKMQIVMRKSSDEGRTWTQEKPLTPIGFHALNNDRVIRLSSGRLLAPIFFSLDQRTFRFGSVSYYSDDDGETWGRAPGEVTAAGYGCDEPVVVELKDGRLLMFTRTDRGKIYSSYSHDQGLHWSESQPTDLIAPSAPCSLKRIPFTDDLLVIWNNRPFVRGARRTPLTSAISRDDGRSWQYVQNLEDDPSLEYDYVSILFLGERVLLSYRVTDKNAKHINPLEAASLKVRVLDVKWFYGRGCNGEPIKAADIQRPGSTLAETRNAPPLSPPDPVPSIIRCKGSPLTRRSVVLALRQHSG